MKKTITCILLTAGLTGYLSAQTPVQDKSDKIQEKSYVWTNKCSWIIYLTTLPVPLTGNTKERNRQLLILRHMVWSLPYGCPSAKSLAKEYKDRIAFYKVDTDKQKNYLPLWEYSHCPPSSLSPNGTATNHYRSSQ